LLTIHRYSLIDEVLKGIERQFFIQKTTDMDDFAVAKKEQ